MALIHFDGDKARIAAKHQRALSFLDQSLSYFLSLFRLPPRVYLKPALIVVGYHLTRLLGELVDITAQANQIHCRVFACMQSIDNIIILIK